MFTLTLAIMLIAGTICAVVATAIFFSAASKAFDEEIAIPTSDFQAYCKIGFLLFVLALIFWLLCIYFMINYSELIG